MFRKDLVGLLLDRSVTVSELAEQLVQPPRDVEADLRHLRRSLRGSPFNMVVLPARCRKCGFAFRTDKLRKPGKCPHCRATWILEPRIGITRIQ
ncbi:MAG: transcriptional regulator [Gammaproteobacteria bacterium]|jgi:transcriptional regulator